MSHDKQDKITAFLFGDAVVTIYTVIGGIGADITSFGMKILATIILGIAGGFAGLAGKDLYKKWKERKKEIK